MKKTKLLLLVFSLWSCMAFSQMAWDFTNWSGDTWNDLEQDTTNWIQDFRAEHGLPPYYVGACNSNGTVFDQEVTANGNVITDLQGLTFDYMYSDDLSKHVCIDLAYAPSRLRLDGGGVILNIHNCTQSDTLTFVMKYTNWKNTGNAATLNLIELNPQNVYKENVVASYIVETDGTASIYLRGDGSLYYYIIHSGTPTMEDFDLLAFIHEIETGDTTWHEPGDTTWYEPGDTTWHKPGDTTWYEPGDTTWYEPGDTTWYEPGDTTWYEPGDTTWYEPGDTTWYEPGDTTWYEPGDTTWYEPGDTTWYEPGDTTWYEPGDTTWYEPGDTTENYWENANVQIMYNSIQVNNTETFRIPIYTSNLNTEFNVIAYQFDFYFDSNVMEYSGYFVENSLSANGSIVVNANDTNVVHVSFMCQDPLSGTGVLLALEFNAINPGYAYGYIGDFLYNTYPIYNIQNGDIDIFELLYGDVDGNNYVQAYDAALTLQYSVGLDPMPWEDPLPWENWRSLRADVDNVEGITANDAALILQHSAKLINTFPVESILRSGMSSDADISITYEDNQLVFRSYGNLIGLNISAYGDISVLGIPVLTNNNMISATNIGTDNYSIGIATAYSPEEGAAFMTIPLNSDDYAELWFDAIVNTTTKSYFSQVGTGLTASPQQNEIICINKEDILMLLNLPLDANIMMYNITGKLMIEKTCTSESETLDIHSLCNGIYLIKVMNQAQSRTLKFVKK